MKRTTKYVALDVHQATTVDSVREESGRVIARSILPTHAVEAADPDRLVPSPAKKAKKKEVDAVRHELGRLKQAYGELALGDIAATITKREEIRRQVEEAQACLEQLRREHKALPSHVPIGPLRNPATLVQLERERKVPVDQIKMAAYRAESELATLLGPPRLLRDLLPRHPLAHRPSASAVA